VAKAKTTPKDSTKVNFGTRKKGKAKKRLNKHDKSSTTYRGQGR
jgi:hypothetical protein